MSSENKQNSLLDDPAEIHNIRRALKSNPFLNELYRDIYRSYAAVLKNSALQDHPVVIELGAGASFLKDFVPQVKYTDVLNYSGIDFVLDGLKMPFNDNSVGSFFMMNVVHHVPDAETLFREINRCLMPGGIVYIFDQNVNCFSRLIYKYLHHEAFDDQTSNWQFESHGPLSSANGALAWILFFRDRHKFEKLFSGLKVVLLKTRYPWAYWVSGGLKSKLKLPKWFFRISCIGENIVTKILPSSGSFFEAVLKKL